MTSVLSAAKSDLPTASKYRRQAMADGDMFDGIDDAEAHWKVAAGR